MSERVHAWLAEPFARLMADHAQLPHALLLQGARGIGKLDFALGVAQSLLCEAPRDGHACGVCDACNWFSQGNHPDFRLLQPESVAASAGEGGDAADDDADDAEVEEGASVGKRKKKTSEQIRIETIRALTDFTQLSAHRGGWRVAVIHPAERMNLAAANALLKTLEEPPRQVMLILVTHQAGRLLPTVISRCRRIALGLPPRAAALAWLRDAAQGGLSADLAERLLDLSGGAPLRALTYADADTLALQEDFVAGLAQPARLDVCATASAFKEHHTLAWAWLTRWLHDLVSQRLAGEARFFRARAGDSARLAARMDLAGLLDFQREVQGEGRVLAHPLNKALLLESWLVRYVELTGNRA